MAPDNKVNLEHASLFIRKVRVKLGVLLGRAKALEKNSAKYPIDRVLYETYSVSTGSYNFVQRNVFLSPTQKWAIIELLESAAINGNRI